MELSAEIRPCHADQAGGVGLAGVHATPGRVRRVS